MTLSKDMLHDILRGALASIEVDEDWYLERHQDVKLSIEAGSIASAKEHFVKYGYFEGKLPYKIPVDEQYYLRENPDVKSAIKSGSINSAAEHFYSAGAYEGRLPSKNFSLFKA
ncbi:hypothetical protein [Methylobacterium aquaticum]|uniref:hypothetical protein n=1 Tax=Methylobacterium aquaticum TaxID=270351 RepID=UPI001931353F|nr:hypothetical protein [Methylobacterium aquaticum]QRE77261.1 hypothetical protein F1D61_30340 [Methylobacterium aquaticum]